MERFSVLIVDAEVDFVETIVKRLRDEGLDAEGVHSDREALEVLDTKKFDVCVLDVKMPGMDGLDTLGEMNEKSPLMEVIMLTGHGSVESAIRFLELGAYDYIMKPVPFADLLKKIIQAYERKMIKEGPSRK